MGPRDTRCDPGLNALDWANRAALRDAGFEEASVDSAAGRQVYFTAGAGRPLVLLHGAGDHAGAWAKTAGPLLAAGAWSIVIPDLAGHGASEPFEGPLEMEALLTGISAVADSALSEPAVFAGNSLGAWLAMLWAERSPARVERIVAVNGGSMAGARAGVSLTPANREEARTLWELLVDAAWWTVPDMMLDELIRKGREGAISRMSPENMAAFLMDGRLDRFATPVDLIWGESDGLVPIDYARKFAAALPAARLTTIPRCGHVPQQECPEQFLAVFERVLEQAPPELPL
jgi:pimeloyl-ACP methyl ester carboxylesterase